MWSPYFFGASLAAAHLRASANAVLLLGVLWSALAVCVLGALS